MIPLAKQSKEPPTDETLFPKFPALDSLSIIVAGGTAGRFSAVVPGLARGDFGSRVATREIRP
jgi:hypothetical protein